MAGISETNLPLYLYTSVTYRGRRCTVYQTYYGLLQIYSWGKNAIKDENEATVEVSCFALEVSLNPLYIQYIDPYINTIPDP